KNALKKKARVIALFDFRQVASIAAAVLFLVGLFSLISYYNSSTQTNSVSVNKESSKKDFVLPAVKSKPVEQPLSTGVAGRITEKKKLQAKAVQVQSKNSKVVLQYATDNLASASQATEIQVQETVPSP